VYGADYIATELTTKVSINATLLIRWLTAIDWTQLHCGMK
jgi:hypothetical protein